MNNLQELQKKEFVILGAGPAGMGAAWELIRQGAKNITVIDRNDRVGGLARTFEFHGYRFDVGPHRFMTKYAEVEAIWKDILGSDLLKQKRLTRIYYDGKFFLYPLKIADAVWNLGFWKTFLAGLSFLKAKIVWRGREPKTFADWTVKAFGERMSQAFFRTYLKKVWGIEAHEVGTDWAGQRIKQLSIFDFFRKKVREFLWQEKTERIGDYFYYPKYGAGTFYQALQERLEKNGVKFLCNREITGVRRQHETI
ncbi:MAG: NAD(P)-binding protein, partial [bacterium]|nr:NAD(P)-binding protein [bacterium]